MHYAGLKTTKVEQWILFCHTRFFAYIELDNLADACASIRATVDSRRIAAAVCSPTLQQANAPWVLIAFTNGSNDVKTEAGVIS